MVLGSKCDLHRHLCGSVSPSTVMGIMDRLGMDYDYDEILSGMVCNESNIGFKAFLDKFSVLNSLPWSPWAIDLSIKQICNDIRSEGVSKSGISFSIGKYVSGGLSPAAAVKIIANAFELHSGKDLSIGLMLSLQYHHSKADQLACANLIDDPDIDRSVCGLDLVGDEDYFDVDFYEPILDKWHEHGKICRAHVGEMPGTSDNIFKSIVGLGVDRIAHGIQATDDVLKLAADRRVCFDLALHSNLATGAWPNLRTHPIKRMLDAGCAVTLNTDDPIQFSCTIDDEFRLAVAYGLINERQAFDIMSNARATSYI